MIAGDGPQDVAEQPRNQDGGEEQAESPGHGAAEQGRNRCRKGGERRSEITLKQATPKGEVLFPGTPGQPIHLGQRLPQMFDFLRADVGAAHHDLADLGFYRVVGREARNDKSQRDPHKNDHEILSDTGNEVVQDKLAHVGSSGQKRPPLRGTSQRYWH